LAAGATIGEHRLILIRGSKSARTSIPTVGVSTRRSLFGMAVDLAGEAATPERNARWVRTIAHPLSGCGGANYSSAEVSGPVIRSIVFMNAT
jgi:hypothetical protein